MSSNIEIPIQNIYYLLCYAWNKLDEKAIVDVSGLDATSILDLFAKVLIGGLSHLLKQGLDRGYVTYREDTRCLRGKICFAPTLKQNLLINSKIHCEYDELSHDILHNRILKATIRALITTESLDAELKDQLVGFFRKLHEIEDVRLNSKSFSLIQLHRNNSFYDFLLKICELIYNNLLISEDPGKSKFRDFIQDRRQMAYLFEEFVRNFYRIEAKDCKVSREDIYWEIKTTDEELTRYLPKMVTDISIERHDRKVVIDTKYSKETLVTHFGKEKFKASDLYQLHAYLTNLESKGGVNENCSGVLLYPTVMKEIDEKIPLKKHLIMVKTINLNQNWKKIENNLFKILDDSLSVQS